MRTVTGPTDSVVVVGAGLGGLSAALHLAGAGRHVTVVER
ncbi:MAG: FAD-dependent oxidoreductase, partial [Jatrophihabitantaceae bacterium]